MKPHSHLLLVKDVLWSGLALLALRFIDFKEATLRHLDITIHLSRSLLHWGSLCIVLSQGFELLFYYRGLLPSLLRFSWLLDFLIDLHLVV